MASGRGRPKPTHPPGRKPWEQQPRESPEDYARFQVYLQLGPTRSLAEATQRCGLSLARLKQLSQRDRWLYRALAWDKERFLVRRRQELEACEQTRARLLKESADWQRIARLEFGSWVRRDQEGNLQLTRELTPAEAIRLWEVGSLALLELQGMRAASVSEPAAGPDERERAQARLRDAIREAAHHLSSRLVYTYHLPVEDALWRVIRAWSQHYCQQHPDPDSLSFTGCAWPWDLPLAEA
jgi:hypothetical protein